MKKLECNLSFDNTCCWMWTLSSIFTGFKILEKDGILKVKSVSMDKNFRADGRYPDRMIVELKADGKTIAYDMSDGYQSINIPELFDAQLDRLDYYFKSSYDPNFALKLRNKNKFLPLAIAYECTCAGNYFEKANISDALKNRRYKEYIFQMLTKQKRRKILDYKNFESHNHFDSYNILFWTRLWNGHVTPEGIMQVYSELDYETAKEKAEKQNQMFSEIDKQRIECVRMLKNEFGERFVGGLGDSEDSRELAPDLITHDPRIETREGYLNSLKGNYINVLSKGLHGCVGARYGETFAAGRAFMTDPFAYLVEGNPQNGINFIEYNDAYSLTNNISKVIDNVDMIHKIENENSDFYNKYIRPDVRILNTLKIAFPEYF